MRNKLYTLKEHLKESLKDPEFRKAWKDSEVEYQLGRALIEKRMAKNISQRQLAKKAHTTQAVISRIESMNSNPSLLLLKKIAEGLGTRLRIGFD